MFKRHSYSEKVLENGQVRSAVLSQIPLEHVREMIIITHLSILGSQTRLRGASSPLHQPGDRKYKADDRWFNEAVEAKVAEEPNQMAIASVDKQGRPSVRMVLLKGYDQRGFIFYTNYDSRKGHQLTQNGYAAICMYWEPLQRQVENNSAPVTLYRSHTLFLADVSIQEGSRGPLNARILSLHAKQVCFLWESVSEVHFFERMT